MKLNKNSKAFVLAYALLFSFLIVSSLTVYITSVINSYAIAKRMSDSKNAYYVADARLTDAFMQLKNNLAPLLSFVVNNASFTVGNGSTGSSCVGFVVVDFWDDDGWFGAN